jgi:membrane protein DedA with SNARE-associated domain
MDNLYQLINQFWTLLQQGQLPEVGRWNYVLLAAIVAVEGPIATLLGAVAASAGLMRPWAVFVAAALGNMTADALWYLLGYSGRLDAALRLGRFVGLRRTHIEHLTTAMQKHGLRILFFAKLTAGFMIPSLIAAGMVRLPWKRWLPVLLLGEFIWTGTLLTIGYFTTESIKLISREISFLVLGVSIVFLAVVIWQGRRILFKTQEFNEAIHARDENIPAK